MSIGIKRIGKLELSAHNDFHQPALQLMKALTSNSIYVYQCSPRTPALLQVDNIPFFPYLVIYLFISYIHVPGFIFIILTHCKVYLHSEI